MANEESSEKTAWPRLGAAAMALALLFVLLIGLRTVSSPETWIRLATGRAIAEQGLPRTDIFSALHADQPWFDGPWLYDWILYRLWNAAGPSPVIILHAAAVFAAFLLLVPVARAWSSNAYTAGALLLCGWLLVLPMSVTPAMLTLLYGAAAINVLERSGAARIRWGILVPLQWFWVQTAPGFLLLPFMALLKTLQETRSAKPSASPALAYALPGALLVLAAANPYGIKAYAADWAVFLHPERFLYLGWPAIVPAAASGNIIRGLIMTTLLLGALGLITQKKRLPMLPTGAALLAAFLVIRSTHYLPLLAVFAFPFVAMSLDAFVQATADYLKKRRVLKASAEPGKVAAPLALAAGVASVILALSPAMYAAHGLTARPGLGVTPELYPEDLAELLAPESVPERCLMLPADGAFLVWRQAGRRVLLDTRPGIYDPEVLRQLPRAMSGDVETLQALLKVTDATAVLLPCTWPGSSGLMRAMLDSGAWKLDYFDGMAALMKRSGAPGADPEASTAGLQRLDADVRRVHEALVQGRAPGRLNRILGAAQFFGAMNRHEQAAGLYDLIVRASPELTAALLGKGVHLANLAKYDEAIPPLEAYSRQRPEHAITWFWLARCYDAVNRPVDARGAAARFKSLSPAPEEAGEERPSPAPGRLPALPAP